MAAKDAYEALADPERRRRYDQVLADRLARSAPPNRSTNPTPPSTPYAARPSSTSASSPSAPKPKADLSEELKKLSVAFASGQAANAERIALEILAIDPRQAMPYAVLGDLARGHGNLNEAQRLYAYAAQFARSNPLYQRRYEELLADTAVVWTKRGEAMQSGTRPLTGIYIGATIAFAGAITGAFLGGTAGVIYAIAGTFLASSLVCGAMASASWLDRFLAIASAGGKLASAGTAIVLMCIAYPIGVILFAAMAGLQSMVHWSVVRFAIASGGVAFLFACAAAISGAIPIGWGFAGLGSVAAIGGVLGWNIGDAIRDALRGAGRQ